MSSPGFRAPLRLTLERSRVLGGLLVLVHLGAATTLVLLPLPLALAGDVMIALSLYRMLRTHIVHTGPRAVKALVWQPSGRIIATDGLGIEHEVTVANDTFVHPLTVVLNLVSDDRTKFTLVLLADSVEATVLRELRKRLRLLARGETLG